MSCRRVKSNVDLLLVQNVRYTLAILIIYYSWECSYQHFIRRRLCLGIQNYVCMTNINDSYWQYSYNVCTPILKHEDNLIVIIHIICFWNVVLAAELFWNRLFNDSHLKRFIKTNLVGTGISLNFRTNCPCILHNQ